MTASSRSPRRRSCRSMSLWLSLTCCLLLLSSSLPTCNASKHNFVAKADKRHFIGPIGTPFGFVTGGVYNLTVHNYKLNHRTDGHVESGFLLAKFPNEAAFSKYEQELLYNGQCALLFQSNNQSSSSRSSSKDELLLSMADPETTWKPNTPSVSHVFTSDQQGLYFLMYQVCSSSNATLKGVRSRFELDLQFRNYDSLGYASFLTAGEMPLPHVFLYFTISYLCLLLIWACNIRKIQKTNSNKKVFAIHQIMTLLLILKTLSVLAESIRYHYIRVSGHAELWTLVYYVFAMVKGMFLFGVVVLIGSGWSFVKPFLTQNEKRVIFCVLVLQVVDNIALVVLANETEGESWYDDWSAVLHLVDIICCCAVLVPIVWQVKALEQQEQQSSSTGNQKTLDKLKLFRSFYLLVVSYIYFTRIVVYLFSTMLGYKYTWVRYVVTELGTLAFYTVTGILFQPMEENPYLTVQDDDEEEVDLLPAEEGAEDAGGMEMAKLEMNLTD